MAQWRNKKKEETYQEEEILERLQEELPKWTYQGSWIRRKYSTSGWKSTLMVINTVGHLAEAAWHHPDLKVGYARVTVLLQTHRVRGITRSDVELAARIHEVASWLPAAEDALDGFPKRWVH